MSSGNAARTAVATTFADAPVVGVVRTTDAAAGTSAARRLLAAGLQLVEVTFTVPGAAELVARLREERQADGPPWIGMGTVTNAARAQEAIAAGADFVVSPNAHPEVAALARRAGRFLVLGALSSTEIVAASELGADLVKVFPLPPVGGPHYLSLVRGPLGDIPMLAAGGFPIAEIDAYRQAGATAFGMAARWFLEEGEDPAGLVSRALGAARGEV